MMAMETLRVLVADDEVGMQHSVARALRNFQVRLPNMDEDTRFDVDRASSGEEALARIASQAPDILLLDYKLGGMTGLDVLEQLATQERDLLTVMITAFATLETAIRATKSGAFDFIAKPFTPQELKETLRKAAEHLVVQRQVKKLAEEKRQVRFQFISVLGHELKAPLSAIEGYLSILQARTAGADLGAYDHIIDRCRMRAEGMRKLIVDLLDMTRIESGQKKRELVELDVRDVAQTAVDTVRPGAESRGIAIELCCPQPAPMTADRGEIEILFNNLLSNAVKYNREHGRVTASISADERRVTIEVADTGIGMSAEEAARLFNDFVRIKNEKTRNITGSGLGLSLVKKLAQLYGGDVTVASRPDVGSTFTLTLQRRPPAPKA
jgi:two-component system, sensor histidine kinase and response regulator